MRTAASALLSVLAMALAPVAIASEGHVDFTREIRPMLEQACVQCHGAEKQKGGLRVDTREGLLKGGEYGASLVVGKPEESELLQRVTLPENEEDVMPPKGKAEHLTTVQVDALKRWIAQGAAWPAGLVLATPAGPNAMAAGPAPTPAEMDARAALSQRGVRVAPLAGNVNWIRVSFRGTDPGLPAETLGELKQLTGLHELDLGATGAGDDVIMALAKLPNIAVLNLAETDVTDASLEAISGMPKLTSLNLFGTTISDAGLAKLNGAKYIKKLYVAETRITESAVAKLRSELPSLQIEDGKVFVGLTKPEPLGPPKPATLEATPAGK